MPTSVLPLPTLTFRRAHVAAFWIVLLAMIAVMLGLGAALLGARAPLAWAAAALLAALPGVVWSRWFEIGVMAWNKLVRESSTALRAYVLHVSYYLLVVPISRAGASLNLKLGSAETSRWVARPSEARTITDRAGQDRPWWGSSLMEFARTPGNGWAVCFLPVVFLLLLERDEWREGAPPAATYTLY